MKTAVEWLQSQIVFESVDEELLARWDEDSDLSEYFEQALQMEKEQKIEFAKHFLYKCKDLSILMAYNQVEQELIKYELEQQEKCKCGQPKVGGYSCQRTDCNQNL